jgi:hypothetical protein
MTEEEWCAAGVAHMRPAVVALGPRLCRLFVCACLRLAAEQIEQARAGVGSVAETVELFADTGKSKAALRRARQWVRETRHQMFRDAPSPVPYQTGAAMRLLMAAEIATSETIPHDAVQEVLAALFIFGQTEPRQTLYPVVREVFGPPTFPTFRPEWCTDTAVTLARTMFEFREFSAMPILADALQDAGCDNEQILSHCRDANQPHVRGCWVVDLVLGKS